MSRIRSIPADAWPREARASTRATHVYLIQEGDSGPCKVGIARNAFWRRSDLQCGNWRQLHVRAVFAAEDRGTAIKIEAAVLSHFQADCLGGEWLAAPPDVLILFIEEAFGDGAD